MTDLSSSPSAGQAHHCRWAWCRLTFQSSSELRRHVIHDHVENASPVRRGDLAILRRLERLPTVAQHLRDELSSSGRRLSIHPEPYATSAFVPTVQNPPTSGLLISPTAHTSNTPPGSDPQVSKHSPRVVSTAFSLQMPEVLNGASEESTSQSLRARSEEEESDSKESMAVEMQLTQHLENGDMVCAVDPDERREKLVTHNSDQQEIIPTCALTGNNSKLAPHTTKKEKQRKEESENTGVHITNPQSRLQSPSHIEEFISLPRARSSRSPAPSKTRTSSVASPVAQESNLQACHEHSPSSPPAPAVMLDLQADISPSQGSVSESNESALNDSSVPLHFMLRTQAPYQSQWSFSSQ